MKIKLILLFILASLGASAQVNWNAYGLRYKLGTDSLWYFPSNTNPVKNLSIYSRFQADARFAPITPVGGGTYALDANVLHKTGDETKTGNLNIIGNLDATSFSGELTSQSVMSSVTSDAAFLRLGTDRDTQSSVLGFGNYGGQKANLEFSYELGQYFTNLTTNSSDGKQKGFAWSSDNSNGITVIDAKGNKGLIYADPDIFYNYDGWIPSKKYVDNAVAGGGGSGTVTSVSSPSGDLTITNPTTTPNLAISTTYSNARDAYANSRVQNSLAASTSIAPSATAVNTALDLKSDVQTYIVNSDLKSDPNFGSIVPNAVTFTQTTGGLTAVGNSASGNFSNYYRWTGRKIDFGTFSRSSDIVLNNTTGEGVGVGIYGDPSAEFVLAYLNPSNGQFILRSAGVVLGTAGSNLTVSASDTIRIFINKEHRLVTATAFNLTTGQSVSTFGYMNDVYDGSNKVLQSIGYPMLWVGKNGSYTVTDFKFYDDNGVTMSANGDSITDYAFAGVDDQDKYVSLVANSLANNKTLKAFGQPGQNILESIQAIENTLINRPKFSLLNIGVNDALQGLPLATFQTRYTQLLSILAENNITPIIVTPMPWDIASTTENALIEDYKDWLLTLSASYMVVDTWAELRQPSQIYLNPAYNAFDGHPNRDGHFIIAKKIINTLNDFQFPIGGLRYFNQDVLVQGNQTVFGNAAVGNALSVGYALTAQTVDATSHVIGGSVAEANFWSGAGTFARFGHKNWNLSANYGLLQDGSNGDVYIDGAKLVLNANGGQVTVAATPTTSTSVVRKTELDTKQNTVSLTTTGTSGAATFNPTTGALNIPNYAGGGGGSQSLDDVLSVGNTSTIGASIGSLAVGGSLDAGYVSKFISTTADNFNAFTSTSGTGEYGIYQDALYFQALTLANGIRFYSNPTDLSLRIDYNNDIYAKVLEGTGDRVVSANSAGKLVPINMAVTDTTTAIISSATLSSTYPSAIQGFQVICPNITTGGLIYTKYASGWVQTVITIAP